MDLITAPTGTLIRYAYQDLDEAGNLVTINIEGRKGREIGMAQLGNRGYIVELADGSEVAVSRYAKVHIVPADPKPTTPLQLWTVTRLDLDDIPQGNLHEVIVAAETAADARKWACRAATQRQDQFRTIWYDLDEFTIRVSHLGEANLDQASGVVIASTWVR